MAIFRTDSKRAALNRLRKKDWKTPQERDRLLAELAGEDLRLNDVSWMLFSRDRALRLFGTKTAKKLNEPDSFEELLRLVLRAEDAPPATLVELMVEFADSHALPKLGGLVRGEDPKARTAAVDVIMGFPFNRSREYVIRLLRSGDRDIRLRALRKVVEERPEQLVGPLKRHLFALARDREERVRVLVVKALSEDPGDDALDFLIDRFRSETYAVRRIISQRLDQLADAGDQRLLDRLMPLLSEGDDETREIAFRTCFKLGDPTELIRRVILYSKSLMGWMRERIHQTVSSFGPEILEPLIKLMENPDEDIRNAALIFSTHFRDPRLAPAVSKLVGDSNWWTRTIAIDFLGNLKDESGVDVLIEALGDEEVRWSAVEALANIASPKALGPIARLLRDSVIDVRIEVIRALEVYNDQRALPLLEQSFKTDSELKVREAALNAYRAIAKKHRVVVDEDATASGPRSDPSTFSPLERLLELGKNEAASDLHIAVGNAPLIRVHGQLRKLGGQDSHERLSLDTVRTLLFSVLDDEHKQTLRRERQVDFAFEIAEGWRIRANVYLDLHGLGGAFRYVPPEPPEFEHTGLPSFVMDIASFSQGLIVVSGVAGSGKTTTLAALVNLINERKRSHIVTIEDPIEFVHPYRNSLVNQRAIGFHTSDYPSALRAALHEDPDVVVVGEIRDLETTRLALEAAETGHVVLGTMQTTSAPSTVRRLVDVFPAREHQQVRATVAETLRFVLCQSLVPTRTGDSRLPIHEILVMNPAIAFAIREDNDHLIPSLLQMGKSLGMQIMDEALLSQVQAGRIAAEDAYWRAEKKEDFEPLVSDAFLQSLREE